MTPPTTMESARARQMVRVALKMCEGNINTLANTMNVTTVSVRNWMGGHTCPTAASMYRLHRFVSGMPLDDQADISAKHPTAPGASDSETVSRLIVILTDNDYPKAARIAEAARHIEAHTGRSLVGSSEC